MSKGCFSKTFIGTIPTNATYQQILKYSQLQLKDCMMETCSWQEGGPTTIGNPITATRV